MNDRNIQEKHRQEWVNSGINDSIIDSNLLSIVGNEAYERLLYGLDNSERTNTGRLRDKWLKRYAHLDHGGWWCAGIDLLTLKESDWGCFKPDRPLSDKGKALKYETPPRVPCGIFALKVEGDALKDFPVGEKAFWDWVISSPVPIVITEGAKKSASLLSQGKVAIALSGIYNFLDSEGRLKAEIERLICPGREFIFAFDQDTRWNVKNNVTAALKKLGNILQDRGCQVSVLHWPYDHGKGIDDFIVLRGQGEFESLFETRLDIEEYLEKHAQPFQCTRLDQFAKFLDTQVKNLEYNLLTDRVEWNGKPIELTGELQFKILHEYNVIASEKMVINGLVYKAKQHSYHPVKRYLDSLSEISPVSIENLSSRYFGTTDPFFDVLVKKWLIGAVARIYEPGCQFDNALILQGEQWAGKSEFFKVLGGAWFDDSFGSNVESAKALMTLHRCWIQEWAEFDKITSKQEFNAIKDFLSRQSDNFVRQYGRDSIEHPRMSVMAGTINPQAFLKDATGDRRFWTIPLPEGWLVPTQQLRLERDRIWSAAVQAYWRGESRYLTREEYEKHQKVNQQFRDEDIWTATIRNWLREKEIEKVSIERILIDCLDFTVDKLDTKSKNRVRDILTALKCTTLGSRKESDYDNKPRRVWQVPSLFPHETDESDNGDNGNNGSDNGSVVVQNPVTARLTTVTTVNNGKNATFLQYAPHLPEKGEKENGGAVVQNPVTARETRLNGENSSLPDAVPAEESYEQGLINAILTHCDRLKWDEDAIRRFLVDKFNKYSLNILTRSELMDLTILLSEKQDAKTQKK